MIKWLDTYEKPPSYYGLVCCEKKKLDGRANRYRKLYAYIPLNLVMRAGIHLAKLFSKLYRWVKHG